VTTFISGTVGWDLSTHIQNLKSAWFYLLRRYESQRKT